MNQQRAEMILEEETNTRHEFRQHLELTDKEHNIRLASQRHLMSTDYGEAKRKRAAQVLANKQIRQREDMEGRNKSVVDAHAKAAERIQGVIAKRCEDQKERVRRREQHCQHLADARLEQEAAYEMQRDEMLRCQLNEEKRVRQLRKIRKRELKAYQKAQEAKILQVQLRLDKGRADQTARVEAERAALADKHEKGALLEEFKQQQMAIMKEKIHIEKENRVWRLENIQAQMEQDHHLLNVEHEMKGHRLDKMERTLRDLNHKIHRHHKQALIAPFQC